MALSRLVIPMSSREDEAMQHMRELMEESRIFRYYLAGYRHGQQDLKDDNTTFPSAADFHHHVRQQFEEIYQHGDDPSSFGGE